MLHAIQGYYIVTGFYSMVGKTTLKKNMLSSDKLNNLCDADLLLQYCKNINDWPSFWEIDVIDIEIGQAIVEQFKPFLISKIKKGRAKKTIRTNAGYLWALGGELIAQLNEDENERRLSARELILNYINESGGPYWRHASDDNDHDRYDGVCKQLFKFMIANSD
jgi:hypothetical protein